MSIHDDINHPSHYELAPGIEAWDVIEATLTAEELRGFCLGNILKYKLRAGSKAGQSPEKDLAKANWYRDKLRESIGRACIVVGPNGNTLETWRDAPGFSQEAKQ